MSILSLAIKKKTGKDLGTRGEVRILPSMSKWLQEQELAPIKTLTKSLSIGRTAKYVTELIKP